MRRALFTFAFLLGCAPPSGVFQCADETDCPSGYACVGGYCYAEAPDAAVDAARDSAIDSGIDAGADTEPPPDASPDAADGDAANVCGTGPRSVTSILTWDGTTAPIIDDFAVADDGSSFLTLHGLHALSSIAGAGVSGYSHSPGIEGVLVLHLARGSALDVLFFASGFLPDRPINALVPSPAGVVIGGAAAFEDGDTWCGFTAAMTGDQGYTAELDATLRLGPCEFFGPPNEVAALAIDADGLVVRAGTSASTTPPPVLHLHNGAREISFGDSGRIRDVTTIGDFAYAVGEVQGEIAIPSGTIDLSQRVMFVIRMRVGTTSPEDAFYSFGGPSDNAYAVVAGGTDSAYIVGRQIDPGGENGLFLAELDLNHLAVVGTPHLEPGDNAGWHSAAFRESTGTLYVAGLVSGSATVGEESVSGVVVAAYDTSPSLSLRWVQQFGVHGAATASNVRIGIVNACCVDVASPFDDGALVKRICE